MNMKYHISFLSKIGWTLFLCYWHAVDLIYLMLNGKWKILSANNQKICIISQYSIIQNWEIREMLDLQICFSRRIVQLTAHWLALLMIYCAFHTEVEMDFKTSRDITGFHIQRNCMGESHPCWNEKKLIFFLEARFSFFPVALTLLKMQKAAHADVRKKTEVTKPSRN